MSSIPRMSVSLTPEIEAAIYELRKTDQFCRCSVAEIVRTLLKEGMESMKQPKSA